MITAIPLRTGERRQCVYFYSGVPGGTVCSWGTHPEEPWQTCPPTFHRERETPPGENHCYQQNQPERLLGTRMGEAYPRFFLGTHHGESTMALRGQGCEPLDSWPDRKCTSFPSGQNLATWT